MMGYLGRIFDILFAILLGGLLGAYINSKGVRFAWLSIVVFGIVILSQSPNFRISMIAITTGCISMIALQRAWARNEERRRERFNKVGLVVEHKLPDLRRDGFLSIFVLVIFSAILFERLHRDLGYFATSSELETPVFWFMAAVDQFFRSLLLDLFEVYHLDYFEIGAHHFAEQTVIFVIRLTFTFVVIATVFENVRIRTELKRAGRRAFSKGKANVDVLVDLGDRANEAISHLAHKERRVAFQALRSSSHPERLDAITSFVEDPDTRIRRSVVDEFGSILQCRGESFLSDDQIDRLHALLLRMSRRDPIFGVRSRARRVVKRIDASETPFSRMRASTIHFMQALGSAWSDFVTTVAAMRLPLRADGDLDSSKSLEV